LQARACAKSITQEPGEVREWFNRHAWKVCVPPKGTEGSNPSLSANQFNSLLGAYYFLKAASSHEHMKEGIIGKILSNLPYVRYAYLYRKYCNQRPGHFYSPVVNLDEIEKRQDHIWTRKKPLTGIHFNEELQHNFFNSLVEFSKIIPFSSNPAPDKYRYYYDNKTFAHADGLTLFTALLKYRPKRVIEIGSGFSSSLMLDTNEAFLDRSIQFTFIEPNPEISLTRLLRKEDYEQADVRKAIVQDVDLGLFETLKENDMLFIDNSHVSKTGSDVNFLMTEVLPILKKGVLIQIHDIFYPFEYPKEWLLDLHINWNEIYTVHNFLLFNESFEMIFFSDYMQQKIQQQYADTIPLFFKDRPGSLWIRKVK
jgi:hypothetical protein